MENSACQPYKNSTFVPVAGLSFFAIASGFLMSLIPLSLASFGMDSSLVAWLASIFYLGILVGTTCIQNIVAKLGHRFSLMLFLAMLTLTIVAMLAVPTSTVWLIARFIAGFAVAGVFVVVESWLLMADNAKQRAKRLGLYMTSLYGGSALGQLAIGPLGVNGNTPFYWVIGLLMLAILPPLLVKKGQPEALAHQKISLREVKKISLPAVIGCLVSGMLLGPIYGLMPSYINGQFASNERTAFLMAIIILGGMLVQPLVSYLSTRISKSLLMALFCLLGTIGIVGIADGTSVPFVTTCYFLLGASCFALYPIAITLACETMALEKIVAATELMLLSYSVGSVFGPVIAEHSSTSAHSLITYLAVVLTTTSIYMLIKSLQNTRSGHTPAIG
ncbi:MFS transporter [uncultured Shewanella sp.]|uniref:MFS transporter n=1 Tax=uncultured Shewanella sp. TaxID=173975 RepID=UPI002620D133|nr:MFS transporter [uncultured Shewanella sp.]